MSRSKSYAAISAIFFIIAISLLISFVVFAHGLLTSPSQGWLQYIEHMLFHEYYKGALESIEMCWFYYFLALLLQIIAYPVLVFIYDHVGSETQDAIEEAGFTYFFYGYFLYAAHGWALATGNIKYLIIVGTISSFIYALASVYFFAKGTSGYIWAALCLINGVIPCFWLYGIFALWLSVTIFMFIMGIGTWTEMKRLKRIEFPKTIHRYRPFPTVMPGPPDEIILGLVKRKTRTDLDYLASEASLSKREVERLLMRLLNSGRLTGVLDRETGKFTYIPRHKIEAVFRLIESKGMVSLRELANKFDLSERELKLLIISMRRS